MIDKELESLARSLVKAGFSAQEMRKTAVQYLGEEKLEKLWCIPRQNITRFVLSCFDDLDLKPPFLDIGCGRRSYQAEAIEKFGQISYYTP